jgi:hypothetical protein
MPAQNVAMIAMRWDLQIKMMVSGLDAVGYE